MAAKKCARTDTVFIPISQVCTCWGTLKKIGQRSGTSRWRVCYQRGLPRLVYVAIVIMCVNNTIDAEYNVFLLNIQKCSLTIFHTVKLNPAVTEQSNLHDTQLHYS